MCTLCNSYPCDYRCPNAESKIVDNCTNCGSSIYDSEECWSDNDENNFCSEECVMEYYGIRKNN